tara:strand:- start:227 stop:634 length:408 start_codon:yes stop_codon:yes gene_type:complete
MADKKTKAKAKRFGQPGAEIVSKRSRLREQATKGVEAGIFSSVDEGLKKLLNKKIYGVQSAPVKNKPTGPRKRSPMEKERVLSTMKSNAAKLGGNIRSGEEMEAATKGLKTLTSEGPGRLKLALKGGGRAYGKNS